MTYTCLFKKENNERRPLVLIHSVFCGTGEFFQQLPQIGKNNMLDKF